MSTNKLLKKLAGRRSEQKAPRKRFLAQPNGRHGLGPSAALAAQFFISLLISAFICVHLRLKKGVRNWSFGAQPALGRWTLNVECWMLGESP
jgi:hypothetical protein